jgi:HD-GYP domain-containing protein (c-di-GMP phosphodiesterase class II)
VSQQNESNKHIEISLEILKRFKKELKFDLYVQRSPGSFTKIFKTGDQLDWERVVSYLKKGISYFYCTEEEYQIYAQYVERLGEQLSNPNNKMTSKEAVKLLKELAQYTMHEMCMKMNVTERAVSNAGNVIAGCIDNLGKDPSSTMKIIQLMSMQPYIMKHSIMVSLLSVLLGKETGIESDTNLKIIGMGGFLHDVGVGQLDFDPEDERVLTPEQRKEVGRHPELGKQMLDGVKNLRTETLQIVLQHHEQPNGHGYPNGMRDAEIYPPAKIVAICDTFAAMVTKRTYRDAFSPAEAISRMRDNIGKFDKRVLETFAGIVIRNNT